jgi:hypothetical protein
MVDFIKKFLRLINIPEGVHMHPYIFMGLCILLSIMDIAYTYTNMKILKEHRKNWGDSEYNPLVRASWHHLGLLWGTVFAAMITVLAVAVLSLIIGENEFFQGVLIGMFLMLHHMHYVNYAYISKKYRGKDLPLMSRVFMEW